MRIRRPRRFRDEQYNARSVREMTLTRKKTATIGTMTNAKFPGNINYRIYLQRNIDDPENVNDYHLACQALACQFRLRKHRRDFCQSIPARRNPLHGMSISALGKRTGHRDCRSNRIITNGDTNVSLISRDSDGCNEENCIPPGVIVAKLSSYPMILTSAIFAAGAIESDSDRRWCPRCKSHNSNIASCIIGNYEGPLLPGR